MLIEQCTNHHLSRLAEIFNDYRIHFGQESDLVGSTAFLEERLLKNQAVVFVAIDEESDEYMGFTLLYPMYTSLKIKSTWTLNDMFIADKYRKFGVASKLLEKVKEFGSETAMKRAGQPSELGPAYVFLASDDSSFITGQVIHINGGEVVNG